jgi:hypothetical protein
MAPDECETFLQEHPLLVVLHTTNLLQEPSSSCFLLCIVGESKNRFTFICFISEKADQNADYLANTLDWETA